MGTRTEEVTTPATTSTITDDGDEDRGINDTGDNQPITDDGNEDRGSNDTGDGQAATDNGNEDKGNNQAIFLTPAFIGWGIFCAAAKEARSASTRCRNGETH